MPRLLLSLSLLLFFASCIFAYNTTSITSTSDEILDDIFESSVVGESPRRRKNRFPFSKTIWWWGLKALSVFITVKIKIVLLVLFLGGGIFYGLKVWNGSALGCPEPIIQEIKHHAHDFLPYHGYSSFDHSSPDIYPGYSGYSSGYSGYSDAGAYSNTPPPSFSGHGFAGADSSAPGTSLQTPFSSSPPGGSDGDSAQGSNLYLPPNRRVSSQGRAMDAQSSQMVTDLVFRFLGVNTMECKQRFVCELEFRNPMVEHAMRYMGRDLLRDYRTPKETKAKKFTDCAVLHPNCTFPQKSVRVKQRNGAQVKQNLTIVENVEATEESPTEIPDVVAKYVKNV